MFIGNSLTGVNDLPAIVQSMAASGGTKLIVKSQTFGGYNLEDHWRNSTSRSAITGEPWDFVVLQQGPSSLPDSQMDLRKWGQVWAEEARRVHARPAFYMVWPFRGQKEGFKLVSQSYRNAAAAGKALVLPAGEAWAAALKRGPGIALCEADGLHPTEAGSYLAALVITDRLIGVHPDTVPSRLRLANGREYVVPDAVAKQLRAAAQAIIPATDPAASPARKP